MNKTSVVICSMLAVSALQAQDERPVPNKHVKVQPVQEHVQRPVQHVQPQTHPAFYRRTTGTNPTFEQRLHSQQVQTQNRVYTRGQVQHFNLNGSANPRIQSARFVAGARVNGAQRWQGNNYAAFRSYNAQWHDRSWWHNHHNRIVLIGGGYYYWDNGWWYPAWGYDDYSNYEYNQPIYGDIAPDQIVAGVQAKLQQLGYYNYAIDGKMGPLTQSAIANYQRDHRMNITSGVDPAILNSLGIIR